MHVDASANGARPRIHLVCNAHLDPVWLWEWEEGAAEAISTFRTAADLCEEFDGFVFNHNEVVLYQWVEEYEPALFARIQRLVREGKWHIMGGWYLQPDCNMPSGESFVRQILVGRHYFREKFGATTDDGHQLRSLRAHARAGADPGQERLRLLPLLPPRRRSTSTCRTTPSSGSATTAPRSSATRVDRVLHLEATARRGAKSRRDHARPTPTATWSSCSGASATTAAARRGKDIRDLDALIAESDVTSNASSTPRRRTTSPSWTQRARHAPASHAATSTRGASAATRRRCASSSSTACWRTSSTRWRRWRRPPRCRACSPIPKPSSTSAMRDLLFSEFHDILPGSSIQPVEKCHAALLSHGLETLSRIKARAFFALAAGPAEGRRGRDRPSWSTTPTPTPSRTIVDLRVPAGGPKLVRTPSPHVTAHQRRQSAAHAGREGASNITLDWRKRVVFRAELAPSQMNRFDCTAEVIPAKPAVRLKAESGAIHFKTDDLDVIINTRTGLIDRYRVRGVDVLAPSAFQALVIAGQRRPVGHRAVRELPRGRRRVHADVARSREREVLRRDGTPCCPRCA